MKPLSAKTSKLITCLYKPSLSLVSDDPELKALLGQDNNSMVSSALRYVLSQDISTVIPGLKSISEVETAAKVGNEYNGLTANEKENFYLESGKFYCPDCGLCLPCPQNLDVAAIMRFQTLAASYGLKNWAKKLYNGLEVKADKCNGCRECESKCPYQLPIVHTLKEIQVS